MLLVGFLMMLGHLVGVSESGKGQELVVYQMYKNQKLATPDPSWNPVTNFKIQTLGRHCCHNGDKDNLLINVEKLLSCFSEYDENDEKRIEKCLIKCSDNRFGGDMSVDRLRCNAVQFWM